jgi:ribonuclease HI
MITAYTDGACRISNPGLCSCAWVLYKGEDEGTFDGQYLGPDFHSNNFAEYKGLLNLLEYLYTHSIRNVIIYSDSELVVNQVNQNWQIINDDLRKMATKAYGLLVQGCHVLKHVKGHDECKGNIRADQICNEILDQHMEEYYADSKNLLNRPTA